MPGTVRWFVELSAPSGHPPVLSGPHVFAVLPAGIVAAFKTTDGTEVWRVELAAEQPLAVSGEQLFVAAGEAIHALRRTDGSVLWRQPAGTLTVPLLVHAGWVITVAGSELTARRATDGTVVWTQPVEALRGAPTIEGDALYLPLTDNRVAALDLTTGRTRWQRKLGGAPAQIAAIDRRVYVGAEDKWFYCLDADDGEVKWHRRVGAATIGRPSFDAERVYFSAMDNYARALDRGNGALRWQFGLPFRPADGPAVVGTVVVVPGPAEELRALDAASGKPLRAISFGGPLASIPSYYEIEGIPLVAAITGGLSADWKLSVLEPPTTIPTAPLTVLPGLLVPLLPLPQTPPVAR